MACGQMQPCTCQGGSSSSRVRELHLRKDHLIIIFIPVINMPCASNTLPDCQGVPLTRGWAPACRYRVPVAWQLPSRKEARKANTATLPKPNTAVTQTNTAHQRASWWQPVPLVAAAKLQGSVQSERQDYGPSQGPIGPSAQVRYALHTMVAAMQMLTVDSVPCTP